MSRASALTPPRALHAAHENGIVHRDIKPSNLLLDGNGKIWVTDFGLARRATDAALTRTGDLVGTMRYMSPEQATGQMALVDQRTDIYSLGATLYELLTLEPAMPGQEGQALLRQIERHDPRPPRQLQPKVPLDLQTVVMKGMAKRREDRYATASDFADDLQRVLDGKPIVARPPTLLDRAARWAQRHREIAAAAAAVCLLALAGLAVSTFLIVREKHRTDQNLQLADQNLQLAEKRLQKVHEAVDKLGQDISYRLKNVPGATEIRKNVLRTTLGYYREFVEQDKDNPRLQAELALIYGKIGKLSAELGSVDDAVEADQEAIRIYQALAEANPSDTDYPQRLAVCENNLGSAFAQANKTAEARHAYEDAIRIQEQVLDKLDDKEQCLTELALARNNLGKLYEVTGDFEGAVTPLEQAKTIQEQQLSSAPDNPDRMRNLAATLNNLGRAQSRNHDAVAAERSLRCAGIAEDPREGGSPRCGVAKCPGSDVQYAWFGFGRNKARLMPPASMSKPWNSSGRPFCKLPKLPSIDFSSIPTTIITAGCCERLAARTRRCKLPWRAATCGRATGGIVLGGEGARLGRKRTRDQEKRRHDRGRVRRTAPWRRSSRRSRSAGSRNKTAIG